MDEVLTVTSWLPQTLDSETVAPVEMAVAPREKETQHDYKLIQDTAYARDGNHRIPTPDKTAIMTLSRSLGKRRLGKQQQLLQDITLRCREQEVYDLSFSITKKVNLAEGPQQREGTAVSNPSPRPKVAKLAVMGSDAGTSIASGVVAPSDKAESVATESSSLGNTKFPTRKVLRSPRKDGPMLSSLPRLNISYRKGVTPSDTYYHKAIVLNQQQINGQIQLHHYIQPRTDHLAPLVLPSIQAMGLDDTNVNSYIQARRLNISVAPRIDGRAQIRISARR